MTVSKNYKRRIRTLQRKYGLKYTTALRLHRELYAEHGKVTDEVFEKRFQQLERTGK